MRNILGLFYRIKSFETVTLRKSGMRHVTDYEIVMRGTRAEVSQYEIGYKDGEEVRRLIKRAECAEGRALKLMNRCRVLSWDGFYGKRPKGIKDGTDFVFKAVVNGKEEIYARGSQRFPLHFGDFTDGLYQILNGEKTD